MDYTNALSCTPCDPIVTPPIGINRAEYMGSRVDFQVIITLNEIHLSWSIH